MKRKHIVLILGMCSCIGVTAWAGYQRLPPPSNMDESDSSSVVEVNQPIQQRNWQAVLIREDGSREEIPNLGGYFQTMELGQKERCNIEITGSDLVSDRNVILYTTHGGKINGEIRNEVSVELDNVLRFSYQNGSMGSHALHILLNGHDTMMSFRVQTEQSTETTNE